VLAFGQLEKLDKEFSRVQDTKPMYPEQRYSNTNKKSQYDLPVSDTMHYEQ